MKIADLFCGGGGASRGYADAGFEVVGFDLHPQPDYPYEFHQVDALSVDLSGFDAVHGSPPCQIFSQATKQNGRGDHVNLIPQTRALFEASGLPYVIENVEKARPELRAPGMLCGKMFGLRSYRHRLFETNWNARYPADPEHTEYVHYPYDKRKPRYGTPWRDDDFVPVHGQNNAPYGLQCEAMGIDWMPRKQLVQAIPPAFTRWLGAQLSLVVG